MSCAQRDISFLTSFIRLHLLMVLTMTDKRQKILGGFQMFNNPVEILGFSDGLQRLKSAQDDMAFQRVVASINDYMKKQNMDSFYWQQLDKIAFYQMSDNMDENNKRRELAKKKVIDFVKQLMSGSDMNNILSQALNNFDQFLENLREGVLHKKATLSKETLRKLAINNEYDVQFCYIHI